MSTARYVDSNKNSPHKTKLGHHIFQSGYSAFLFSALSRKDWTAAIQKAFALHIYFSVFSGLILFRTGLYLYDLIQSRNKNLGKVASFIREFIASTIILVTIIGGFLSSTIIAALSPWLFIATMMVNVSYNLAIGLQNTYQFLTAKDQQSRDHYKTSCKKHMLGAFFGFLGVASFSMFMIFKIAPVAICIFSACLSAYGFIKGIQAAVQMYKTEKNPVNEVKLSTIQSNTAKQIRIPGNALNLTKPSPDERLEIETNPLTITSQNKDDYYFYRKNRTDKLAQTGNPKNYLIAQINLKIISLRKQMHNDKNKLFSEKSKRTKKIMVLLKLHNLLINPAKTKDDFYILMNSPQFNDFFNNPFQSFFRQKSDTQDIFEAAEVYYTQLNTVTQTNATTTILRHRG